MPRGEKEFSASSEALTHGVPKDETPPPKGRSVLGTHSPEYLLIVGNNATPETALVISMMGAHLSLQRGTQSKRGGAHTWPKTKESKY